MTTEWKLVPVDLLHRIDGALQRHLDRHAPMRIPVDQTDSDLVQSDVRALLATPDASQWPTPRPMSEAPTDTAVLAWWPRQQQWAETTWFDFLHKWACDFATSSSPQPTHWLPMPAAPTDQQEVAK